MYSKPGIPPHPGVSAEGRGRVSPLVWATKAQKGGARRAIVQTRGETLPLPSAETPGPSLSSRGATLLEVMIVMALGFSLALMGIQEYQTQRAQADLEIAKYNVEQIFQGMARYYYANCRTLYGSTASPPLATLDPINSPSKNYTVHLSDIGISPGILQSSNLQQGQGLSDANYVLQFNGWTGTRSVYGCYGRLCSPAQELTNSVIQIWLAQVSIQLNSSYSASQMNYYQQALGATCVSDGAGTCESNPKSGQYLVWERLPSDAAPNTNTGLWPTLIRTKQFTELYTNSDNFVLNNASPTSDTNPYYYNYPNYLCGG